ncbi:MAG TPA: NYN domain-containing protein [Spirochaetales bacterium]|nr:NYN domain-containing protein [Spirochaetales bacterium]
MNVNNKEDRSQLKLAVLVDADNTQSWIVEGLLGEVAKYGIASVKRIYGDWTTTNLKHWKDKLLDWALQPIQQFSYTSGKNSTDSAMIIDAMDLLYTEKLDGFCIVSSDSDFTRLAARLREAGKLVIGFGERKTPKPFVAACDKFLYTEILREEEEEREKPSSERRTRAPAGDWKNDRKLRALLVEAVEDSADEFGWSYLGPVGQYVTNRQPDFDPRNYGFRKFGELIRGCGWFDVEERQNPNDSGKQIFVRARKR